MSLRKKIALECLSKSVSQKRHINLPHIFHKNEIFQCVADGQGLIIFHDKVELCSCAGEKKLNEVMQPE